MSVAAVETRPAVVRYTLGLLFVIYTFNYLDRQIVNILAEPIKVDLKLHDWQLGLVSGLAFALFYTILGIPLARFADRPRTDRVKLVSICLALWSGMTALCGTAGGFIHLLLARIGVGVGEAGGTPSSHSLISDLIPPEKRASALSVYALGVPIGKLLGLGVGGLVAHSLGWRATFMILGLPGVVLALLAWFTLPEPRRAITERVEAAAESLWRAIRAVITNRTFCGATWGATFMAAVASGQNAFLASLLIRVHGLNVGQAGLLLGLALGGAGAIGTWLGGRVVDRRGHNPSVYMSFPGMAVIFGAGLFAAGVLATDLKLAIVLIAFASVANQTWYGPVFATVQGVSPPARRATAAAVHLFLTNLIGSGLGPLAIGGLSDAFNTGFSLGPLSVPGAGPADGLRYALACAAISPFIALLGFAAASRTIKADLLESR